MSTNRVGYGQRRVRITPELIELLLVRGKALEMDLPEDARLTSLYHADGGDTYYLIFESEAWDELAEGEELPVITPEVAR